MLRLATRSESAFHLNNAGASVSLRDDQIAFVIVPLVAEADAELRGIALLKQLVQFRLVVLFEKLDRANVGAKQAQIPFVAVEMCKRDPGVVLHDKLTVIEDEIS